MTMTAQETSPKTEFDAQRTLRDIAVRLAAVAEFAGPRDIATRELLSLLRDGRITAHAHTSSEIIPKVPVSPAYWRSINNFRFKQIEYVSDNRSRKGTFLIPCKKIFSTYLELVFATHTSPAPGHETQALDLDPIRDDIDTVVRLLDKSFEVIVFESEWQRFLAAGGYVEQLEGQGEEPGGEARGRPEKAWRALMPYLLAKIVVSETSGKKEKYENIAAVAVNAAKAGGAEGIPEISTVTDEVGKIMRQVTRLKNAT